MAKPRVKPPAAAPEPCGCAVEHLHNGLNGDRIEHPRRAAGVEASLKEANLKQLRRIEGQVRGIAAMIEDDRYCAEIITQVSAVRESLNSVARNLLRNHLKHCAAAAMQKSGAARDEMINELVDLAGKVSR